MEPQLQERINRFVEAADRRIEDYWKECGYTMPLPKHRADQISDKWVRVVTVENYNGIIRDSSVYAFICLKDYSTKALGQLRTGDIHKAASFKVAAKHARGNVLVDGFEGCLTPFGIVYLK